MAASPDPCSTLSDDESFSELGVRRSMMGADETRL